MLLDSPGFPLSSSKFTMDYKSVRQMIHTRTCPSEWRRWAMATYAHCQPFEDEDMVQNLSPLPSKEKDDDEPLLTYCNDKDHSKIFDGTMSVEEWSKAVSNVSELPSLLLLTGKANAIRDGGVAFQNVYHQVIDNVMYDKDGDSNAENSNINSSRPMVTHVDAKTSHVTMYVAGDSKSIHTMTTEWTTKFLKKWAHKT